MKFVWSILGLGIIAVVLTITFNLIPKEENKINIPSNSPISISQEVIDSNARIELKYSMDKVYTFNPHAGNNNFLMNSLYFKDTESAKLKSGYEAIEFKVRTSDTSNIFLSYNNTNYYDVFGNYYTGSTKDTKIEVDTFKLVLLSRASGVNEYNVRFDLEKYYQTSKTTPQNATVSLSYLGSGEIYISNVKYVKSDVNSQKDLEIISKGLTMDEEAYGFKVKSGLIESNVKLDKIYFNCNDLGIYEIKYDEYKVYENNDYYYRYKIGEQQLGSHKIYGSNTTANIDLYVVYNDKSYKVLSKTCVVKGYNVDFNINWIQVK